jgi:soluble cytochrome b562
MRERIVISACIVLLTAGAAHAEDAEQACMERLAETETLVDQRVEAKALSEGDVEDVNMLLDEADAFCTEGNYKKANETLANVNKMIAPAPEPAQ